MSSSKKTYEKKIIRRKEEKAAEPELPKYRDRAKERREDQNPDYEPTDLGSFHAVAPPGAVDIRAADAHKLSIEKSKYLGGDVEHTHLVKGLDYALLHKVRSEIDTTKKPDDDEEDADGMPRAPKDDQPVSFRTATAKSVYQLIVKPQITIKTNEMFLPGRMSFIFNTEGGFSHDIPTTLHRSKADCPIPEEMVTVSVDGSVLDRIAKIMSYLRLGSSGKVLKKKKKDKEIKGKVGANNAYDEDERAEKQNGGAMKHHNNNINNERQMLPPPPPPPHNRTINSIDKNVPPPLPVVRTEEDDIFVGEGIDYAVPTRDGSQSPISEDMEESPRSNKVPYFSEPAYGPVPPPSEPSHEWQQMNGYESMQTQALAAAGSYQGGGGGVGEWQQDYQYAEQLAYSEQYLLLQQQQQQNIIQGGYDPQTGLPIVQLEEDPHLMTQEEKDRGLGSVFKRDDQRLLQLREKDAREKDPNFVSENYSECYPGYQEYNREVVDSDEEDDLSKMDMGGRAKGRLHRWDFETEDEWAKYNEQKEAMPKAAYQFGVKMQDGRKTRKQNRDQKLNNDLHKINKILSRKKDGSGEGDDNNGGGGGGDDDSHPGKKIRI
ncbi:suppressor of mec-8 and unc-52 protein homolog 2 [Impatiens glandulifera]|uniref:suppressor of mec-8 and unc-52 protein homolog 2 n=1 Tax=Impatiens glandulifera TaxID=253017 RepID=UPI001FB0C52D|nr:suppressor of mec-8 and unc-52 protein homolog 2 [Impatiens glandulifera]